MVSTHRAEPSDLADVLDPLLIFDERLGPQLHLPSGYLNCALEKAPP